MMKKVLTAFVAAMLAASAAFAAPAVDLEKGEATFGYTYSRHSIEFAGADHGKADVNNLYGEYGLDNKLILGLEYSKVNIDDLKQTDIYLKYRLDKNFSLVAGNRDYSGGSAKFLYGINVQTNIAPNVTGYTGVVKTDFETQWRIGAVYAMDKQTYLDFNYMHRTPKEANRGYKIKGFGIGIGYKF